MRLVSRFNRVIAAILLVIAPLLLHAKPHESHSVSDSEMHLSEIGVAELIHSEHSIGDCCSALCGPVPPSEMAASKPVVTYIPTPYSAKLLIAVPWLLIRPPIANS